MFRRCVELHAALFSCIRLIVKVTQEAEDVLAIAGVNPDDEAKLLFVKQTERRRSDAGVCDYPRLCNHDSR